jgi:hypothetical protein
VKKWKMWIATFVCLSLFVFFVIWGIQTAWLGSFPDSDHAKYSIWALVQFAAAVVFAVAPVIGWILLKRQESTKQEH